LRAVVDSDDGKGSKELSVTVSPGAIAAKAITFGKGRLVLRATPWADVRIDGRLVGQTPMPRSCF